MYRLYTVYIYSVYVNSGYLGKFTREVSCLIHEWFILLNRIFLMNLMLMNQTDSVWQLVEGQDY